MKAIVLYLSFLFLAAPTVQAQTKKELATSLARDMEIYRRVTLRGDFDSTFHFMPPKMFDLVPRDSLLAMMINAMNNEYMSIDMTGFQYKGKPKIKKAGSFPWAFVSYEGQMKIHLKGEDSFNKLMIPMMKTSFGSKNVVEVDDKTLAVSMPNKRMIAYKDPAASSWSFIEDKRNEPGAEGARQKAMLDIIMPEEVLKAVGKK